MNRDARRRAARKGVSHKDIVRYALKERTDERVAEATDKVALGLLGLPCLVLRDKFGFGSTRLDRFVDALLECYDSYDKGHITLDDIKKVLDEEVGITIQQ